MIHSSSEDLANRCDAGRHVLVPGLSILPASKRRSSHVSLSQPIRQRRIDFIKESPVLLQEIESPSKTLSGQGRNYCRVHDLSMDDLEANWTGRKLMSKPTANKDMPKCWLPGKGEKPSVNRRSIWPCQATPHGDRGSGDGRRRTAASIVSRIGGDQLDRRPESMQRGESHG